MKTIRNGLFESGIALWNAFRVRHRFIKKILIGSLSIVTLFTFGNMTNYASAQTIDKLPQSVSVNNSDIQIFKPSPDAQHFVDFMLRSGLIKEFKIGSHGELSLKEPLSIIEMKYNLDATQMKQLKQVLSGIPQNSNFSPTDRVSPQVFYRDGIVYFTHSEVEATLFAAASLGPEALLAALEAYALLTGARLVV